MNNSANYVRQVKNAKRGGYTPTIAKDVNKHKIQKAIQLIEQWRKTRKRIETPNANRYGNHLRRMRTRSGSYFKEKISLYFKTDKDLLI